MPISAGLRDVLDHVESLRFISGDADDPDQPNYQSLSYRRQVADLELVTSVYGGTKTMRGRGVDLLPLQPNEEQDDWRRRKDRATAFNAYKRTVHSLVGMVFRKPPMLEASGAIAEHAENIDLGGRDVETFAADLCAASLRDGHTYLLVEMPVADPSIESVEDERNSGRRPYWVEVAKADAINVQYEMRDGRAVLTLFAFSETHVEPAGEFGEVEYERVRVLRPGSFEVWQMTADGNRWELVEEGTTSLDYVPVVWLPSGRVDHYESEPPLLDLAYEQVEHYQVRSDHRHALMFASHPMPAFFGVENLASIEWGANRALAIPDPNSSAMLLESTGASLASSRQELKDIEARMAALGLQMLVRETRAAETAEAKIIDKSESDSALAKMAAGWESALNAALAIHADYLGSGEAALTLNDDYRAQEMTPSMLAELRGLVREGNLSQDELWLAMQRGEILEEDFDPELERERIESVFALPALPQPTGALGDGDDDA